MLDERELTYKQAVEIAQGVEISDANLREIKTPQKSVTVKTEPVHQIESEKLKCEAS